MQAGALNRTNVLALDVYLIPHDGLKGQATTHDKMGHWPAGRLRLARTRQRQEVDPLNHLRFFIRNPFPVIQA